MTIVRHPKGDPTAKQNKFWLLKKTCYGLRCSPHHWFVEIDKILKYMGLKTIPYNPCAYSGYIKDPDDPTNSGSSVLLTMGLYVDNFIFFSNSDAG